MSIIPKACVNCGLPAGSKSRCSRCDPKRGNQGRPWYGPDYQRIRARLWRDGPPPCFKQCGRPATQLHHVAPRSSAGGFIPLCDACHREMEVWDTNEVDGPSGPLAST